MNSVVSTKASTLSWLEPQLATARVLPAMSFTVLQWKKTRATILTDLQRQPWSAHPLIVRSSAIGEDSQDESLAGKYCSKLDINWSGLPQAIESVISSYDEMHEAFEMHELLVQPFLKNATMSGVAFSRDPASGASYIIISYDVDGDTTAVTAGKDGTQTYYYARGSSLPDNERLAGVIKLTEEVEALFGGTPVDIEFAFDAEHGFCLLQARPLLLRTGDNFRSSEALFENLTQVATQIDLANKPHPYLKGRRTVFGVMPDWNPAEIIGIKPRPLSLSLYRELVTDSIWAYQRSNYGYRNLRSFPLMVDFHGLPYIDVRVSFNSFIPADLDGGLAERLVDYYIDQLISYPALHDKVEFEILYSCYTFDLAERLESLPRHVFQDSDRTAILESLRALTNRIINRNGLWKQDTERILQLEDRQSAILSSELDPIGKIYWLLEDCKRYGPLPFAGLERAGFIAVQMLNSLVSVGILNIQEKEKLMRSLNSVSGQMTRDIATLDATLFQRKYGHLRPGTYDILSSRYDEDFERYFDKPPGKGGGLAPELEQFSLTLEQMRAIDRLLTVHGLDHDVIGLFEFIEGGITGRELAKFHFSRSLSDALVLLKNVGDERGFDPEALSYLDISSVRNLYANAQDTEKALSESVAVGYERYKITRELNLPPLILSSNDVWQFHQPRTEPNYITQKRVTGPVKAPSDDVIEGTILAIENADPGYDWIFTRGIAGFVTAYGGVNSHMAIRASELGVPAAIGVGDDMLKKIRAASMLELDAENKKMHLLG